MGYHGNIQVVSSIRTVADTLRIIMECVQLFISAEEEQRISFDHQIIPTAFEIIGTINAKASKLSAEGRERLLAHIRDDGPTRCLEMIAEAQRRSPPVIHRSELVQGLDTDTTGW